MSHFEYSDSEDSEDSIFENIPEYFFHKRWPFPKLPENGNNAIGEDVALAWLMEVKRNDILDEEGVDILNIGRRNQKRYSTAMLQGRFY